MHAELHQWRPVQMQQAIAATQQPELAQRVAALDDTCAHLSKAVAELAAAPLRVPSSPPAKPLRCDMTTQVTPVVVRAVAVQRSPKSPAALVPPAAAPSGGDLSAHEPDCAAGITAVGALSDGLAAGCGPGRPARRERSTPTAQAKDDGGACDRHEIAAPRSSKRHARTRSTSAAVRSLMHLTLWSAGLRSRGVRGVQPAEGVLIWEL